MASYEISKPKPDVVRVLFTKGWNADAESEAMFRELYDTIDKLDDPATLLIVAGEERPVYTAEGLPIAQDILFHDNLKQIIIVADDPHPGVTHMSAFRGERGFPRIPTVGCKTEEEAQQYL